MVSIWPKPKEVTATGQGMKIVAISMIALPEHASVVEKAASERLAVALKARTGREVAVNESGPLGSTNGRIVTLRFGSTWPGGASPAAAPAESLEESYDLKISSEGIVLSGGGPRGLAYALQTVQSILECLPKDAKELPGVHIRDWPDHPIRAALVHLSHCNQYKNDKCTFKMDLGRQLIETAGRGRMNMLILDIKDGMVYRSHPEISLPGAISQADVAALVELARSYGMDVVPKYNLSTTHLGWILPAVKVPEEVDTEKFWKVAEDVANEIIEVVKPEHYFHAGFDEDRGRNREKYLERLLHMHKFLADRKLTTMIWADQFCYTNLHTGKLEGPEKILDRVPKDVVMVDWRYQPFEAYPSTLVLAQRGYTTLLGCWTHEFVTKTACCATHSAYLAAVREKQPTAKGLVGCTWATPTRADQALFHDFAEAFWNVPKDAKIKKP